MGELIQRRIDQLRQLMKKKGIDAYYVSGTDPHQSEDVPQHWQARRFITGFTGSLGMVAITAKAAALWTDSRYFLQAPGELEGSGVQLMKLRVEGTPAPDEWLRSQLPHGGIVATDTTCLSISQFRNFKIALKRKRLELKNSGDLLAPIWIDREPIPLSPVFEHELKYAGLNRSEKIDLVRREVGNSGADATLITALDDVAWTFNLRGNDVVCNPVFIAYGLLSDVTACLYINPLKLPAPLSKKLNKEGILVKPYEAIFDDLPHLRGKVLIDPDRTSQALAEALPHGVGIIEQVSVPAMLKAVKSEQELRNIRETMRIDGVAMVEFLYWLDQAIGGQAISDCDIAQQLEVVRSHREGYQGPAFPPIVGYQQTGAVVHRRVTPENAVPVERKGILLIDTGGHYLSGTTDITRTIALSEPTPQQKEDFTIVLKGMINLTTARFPAGTRGCNLDILARKALWDRGLNYGHGTSHGIGYFLNVHEGPMSIRQEYNDHPLRPGMVLSNEPGIYREGQYGVRTENMMVCVGREKTAYGQFYGFETLTLCPIDRRLIESNLLSPGETDWINRYHQWCYHQLAPLLQEGKRSFLKSLTAET